MSSDNHHARMNADDERLARVVRLLRVRQPLTQRELAALAGVPCDDLIKIEAGMVGDVRLDRNPPPRS